MVAVLCEGWRSINVLDQPAEHSISYCGPCWRLLAQERPAKAPALAAIPLTRAGRRLLEERTPAPPANIPVLAPNIQCAQPATLCDWLGLSDAEVPA
jgi:hypothetical protein